MTKLYTDFDLMFSKSDSNDLTILSTQNTIKQSIKNLLLTKREESTKYELPELGSKIHNLLSERATKLTALQIRDEIETTLVNYEPRIKLNKINIDFDAVKTSFVVYISYNIISLSLNDTLTLILNVIQ